MRPTHFESFLWIDTSTIEETTILLDVAVTISYSYHTFLSVRLQSFDESNQFIEHIHFGLKTWKFIADSCPCYGWRCQPWWPMSRRNAHRHRRTHHRYHLPNAENGSNDSSWCDPFQELPFVPSESWHVIGITSKLNSGSVNTYWRSPSPGQLSL